MTIAEMEVLITVILYLLKHSCCAFSFFAVPLGFMIYYALIQLNV